MKKQFAIIALAGLVFCSFDVRSSSGALPKTEKAFSGIESVVIVAETTISDLVLQLAKVELVNVENLSAELTCNPLVYRLETITAEPCAPADLRIKPVNIAQNRKPPKTVSTIFKRPRDYIS